ncbi:MAG: tRNA (adenosine(37)-N6)-threonylcarbamoyltransferase complex ATPase subunit type 1 TsaE [Holosporales bacterium]|jgi:tRNA A37 threonylcarbamoyladenosine biosynthesis protein TsaE|nr:tRNA (adenosine(37)-N6)-threonylcarbamoyltransferase complex ATPase subunit type 1 TsaE [Holosporales bacterium]
MLYSDCSIEQVISKASSLAQAVLSPTCIFLWGDLGAGKTTFAKSFIRSYYDDQSVVVPSPTFTIIQTYSARTPASQQNITKKRVSSLPKKNYELSGQTNTYDPSVSDPQSLDTPVYDIWHVDLYRVKDIEDVFELGLDEAIFQNICLIEWPDCIRHINVANKIEVFFEITTEERRSLKICE